MFDLGAMDPAEKHDAQIRAVAKALHTVPGNVLQYALDADPTPYKIYLGWILKQMKYKNIILPEDRPRVFELLLELNEAKRVRPPGIELDINKYRTIHDLSEAMDQMLEMYSGRELERPQEVEDLPAGVTPHAESEHYRVLEITNPDACVTLGRGTKWCVREYDVADKYIARYEKLYLILSRNGDRWVVYGLYTPDYSQIMDTKNRPIMIDDEELIYLIGPDLEAPNADHNALMFARDALNSRWPLAEPIIAQGSANTAFRYAKEVVNGRWPMGEPIIAQNADISLRYAKDVIHGRWAPGEPVIASDSMKALAYATEILHDRFPLGEEAIIADPGIALAYLMNVLHADRWPEAESSIAQHPEYAFSYARNNIRGPWPLGEAAIATNPSSAFRYASEVLGARFPEGEAAIASNADTAVAYAEQVLHGPFPEAEALIAKGARYAYLYARDVLGRRFPEAEAAIAKEPQWAFFYARDVIRGRWPEGEASLRKNNWWLKEYEELFEG